MTSTSKSALCLTELPIEILLDIYHHLDLPGIFNLCAVNRSLHDLFSQKKVSILLPVLARDFSPFDELLQIYTASSEDLAASNGIYTPRKIIFRRHPRDTGIVLAPRPGAWSAHMVATSNGFKEVAKAKKPNAPVSTAVKTTILTEEDIGPLLEKCRLVRSWEERFPQMRWFHQPEDCRTLRPHEAERFRRAFYRWWLYGFYFHGDFERPRAGLPEPFVDDIRTSQMRYHSTTELLELMDLVESMKDVVLHYICPRLDPNQHQRELSGTPYIETADRPQSLLRGWTDQSPWGRIVKTYAKLGPKELMFFFENIYSYPRKRLITEVRLQCPSFTYDQESIQTAIRCALDERQWLERMPSLAEDTAGGIVDFDDERDSERVTFADDASPDGSLPPGIKFHHSLSQYSPRGDDGWYLEEPQPQAWGDWRVRSALLNPVSP